MVINKSVERECFGCNNQRPAEHFKSEDSEVCDYCKLKAGISSPRLEQAKKQLAKDEKRQRAPHPTGTTRMKTYSSRFLS